MLGRIFSRICAHNVAILWLTSSPILLLPNEHTENLETLLNAVECARFYCFAAILALVGIQKVMLDAKEELPYSSQL